MICFVYELNPSIGSGHFMRCKSVQETLMQKFGIPSQLLAETDFNASDWHQAIVVFDLFDTAKTTKFLRDTSNENVKICFDYFSNEEQPDLNISVLEQFHEKRSHPNYTGLDYCVLRPDFLRNPVLKEKLNEVFVYIGGNGFPEVVRTIADKFADSPFHFNLIRNQNSLDCGPLPDNFSVHFLPENLIELMNRSTFAITSPGLATMELLYLQVPSVLCPLIDFHEYFSDFLLQEDLAISRLDDFDSRLLENLPRMRESARKKVDGKGVERIIHLMLNAYEEKMGSRYPLWA